MKVFEPGHLYGVKNFEDESLHQTIQFIEKEPFVNKDGKVELKTINDGTTNEELLEVLIDRISILNAKFPCEENAVVLGNLYHSLNALNERTANREKRGVEGKHEK